MKNHIAKGKWALALLLCACLALPAAAESDATYYYPAGELHTKLFISPTWEDLIVEDDSIVPYETEDRCVFYYYPEEFPDDIGESELFALLLSHGVPTAGISMNSMPEGFEGREVYAGEFTIYAIWAPLEESTLPEGAPVEALAALIASFRDTDEYISVILASDGIGTFNAEDFDGTVHTEALFADADVTMINVWATYCQPCLSEMPDLGMLAQEYAAKGVQIVGIPRDIFDSHEHIDEEQLELAKEIVSATGADYTHLIADENLLDGILQEVMYVPTTYFVDSTGCILGEALVGSRSMEEWATILDEMLLMVQ